MFYFSFTLICASSGKLLAMEPPTQLSRQARRMGRGKDRELAWGIAWPARRFRAEKRNAHAGTFLPRSPGRV